MTKTKNAAQTLVAALAFTFIASASAATRHVAATGADTTDCTVPAMPCRTIAHAMSQAAGAGTSTDGDLVSVGPGVYGIGSGEKFPLIMKPGVQLVATAAGRPDETVIDGAGSAMGILEIRGNNSRATRIEGFTFRNGTTVRSQPGTLDFTSVGGAIRVIDGASGLVTITRNVFRGNVAIGETSDGSMRYFGGAGRALGGAIGAGNAAVVISSNLFVNNSTRGGKGYDHPDTPYVGSRENGGKSEGGAIGLADSTGAIVNNTFEGNAALAGEPGRGSNGSGFPGPAMGGAVRLFASNTRVVSNIFSRNQSAVASGNGNFATAGALRADAPAPAPEANLFFGTVVNGLPTTAGDTLGYRAILADPRFVSANDFHVGPLSPAIGAGTADAAAPIDIDGTARPNPPSIGAYEAPDMVPPDTVITSAPTGTVTTRTATITFSSPEATASFLCSVDGGAYAPCTSPVNLAGLADGPHNIRVSARDAAGNVDPSPAAVTWFIGPLPAWGGVKYNALRMKSSHNSYERHEALLDQLVFHRVRSIELDIHNGKSEWLRVPGNWYVYHSDSLSESQTTCHRLSDCLNELRAFHLANPNHEVVTVFLDLKDENFELERSPVHLDNLIKARLPENWLLKPSDLRAACPNAATLKDAVTGNCSWPTHLQLRGKFIFALTGGNLVSWDSRLNQYVRVGQDAWDRVAFVAPDLTSASGVAAERPYAIFYNINVGDATPAVLDAVHDSGFIARVWGVTGSSWGSVSSMNVNHIGTDYVSHLASPWAVTHNALGWPFQCLDWYRDCDLQREAVDMIGIEAYSGDIWNGSDSFMFAYEYTPDDAVGWNVSVATPNSHVEEWGKGCLMARANLSAGSPYVAMCRAADRHRLRVQYRTSQGGSTSSYETDIVPGDTIDQESLTFVALDVVYGSSNKTCVNAYGAQSVEGWAFLKQVCIPGRLPYQGLAVSSHGSGWMKMLFSDLRRNEAAYGSLPAATPVGSGSWGRVFQGFAP